MKALLTLSLTTAFATGCATYQRGTLAALSTAPLPVETTVVAERVEGEACENVLAPSFKLAIDAALEKAPGANALVDASYSFERFCTIVRGTAVRLP